MAVERRSIDFIPESERHGSVKNLFAVWFSANAQITTVVTGALAVAIGLNFWDAVLAIVIGNLLGGIFMAYHSAQGPKLGIPQMIQSRAQFGVVGAVLPLVLVIVMYVGFFATSAVLGAQALSAALHLPQTAALIVVNILALLLVMFGYDWIHRFEKITAYLFFILFVYLSVRLLMQPHPHGQPTPFSFASFLLVVSIMATWQITYAPYVADYSRYLPGNTSVQQAFWYTFYGSVLSSSWMMILGAGATIVAPSPSANMVSYLASLAGSGLSVVTLIVIVLGVLAINTLNLYGGFMSVVTTLSAFRSITVRAAGRTSFALVVAVVATAISIWGQGDFLNNYSKFLLLLLYFMVPWTAINLVDFYFLRRGQYNIEAIFRKDGEYGIVNWIAVLAYVIAVLLQVPFMNTELYVGPIAKALGGADIAWIVGILVAGALYYYPMKRKLGRVNSFGANMSKDA